MNLHEAIYGPGPKVRPRPVVGVMGLVFIPVVVWFCFWRVRVAAEDDFLGIDIMRAFWLAGGAVNIALIGLSIWALVRYERPIWPGYLLMLIGCLWLPFLLGVGYLLRRLANE
jgi:hypothetical protein